MPRLIVHGFTISLDCCVLSMALCLCACGERTSSILPEGDLHHLEDYHCWPYDVSVYSIDEMKLDSAFHHYPLDNYFSEGAEHGITHWTRYNEIDTALWNGMDSTLKECDGNADLYRSLLGGGPIYFAGTYRNMIVSNGSRKRMYERILFLDVTNHRLHIFKDINKVF
jgi:hypothetical protein